MSVTTQKMITFPQATQDFPWARDILQYSINLMWINKKLIAERIYINDAKTESELSEQLLVPALKWAKANPSATVNLWYDSVHTSQESLKRTQEVLASLMAKEYKDSIVHLRDVREIPIVKDNPDAFSDYLPVYFRVDLLKAIIVVDAIERLGDDSAIFSDLEVGDWRTNKDRMSKEELFSPLNEDSSRFAKAGLILNKEISRNENQFIQLYNNPAMIFAIQHAVINVNLTRAISALSLKHKKRWLEEDCVQSLATVVYPSIQVDVFAFYEAITSPEYRLTVRPDIVGKGTCNDTWVLYNPDEHGYTPFGLHCFNRTGVVIYRQNENGKNECIRVKTVFKLPEVEISDGAGRKVDVRGGSDHYKFAYLLPAADRIPKPAFSNDGIYRCVLLDTRADRLLMFEHWNIISNDWLPIKELRNLIAEYLSDPQTLLEWRKQYKAIRNYSTSSAATASRALTASMAPSVAASAASTAASMPSKASDPAIKEIDLKTAKDKPVVVFSSGPYSAALPAIDSPLASISTAAKPGNLFINKYKSMS
jgi:hypothetical protein